MWKKERKYRLTASDFGKIISRRLMSARGPLVYRKLYATFRPTKHMKYGSKNEKVVLDLLEQKYKLHGQMEKDCGLFVDLLYGFLAASPDALVGTNGLAEVKCVPSLGKYGLYRAAQLKKPNFCLEINKQKKLQLKPRHLYMWQVQGQLNITDREHCYFAVMCDKDKPVHTEIIKRDKALWQNVMLPKLVQFYRECLAPEIVNPMVPRNRPIREPVWVVPAAPRAPAAGPAVTTSPRTPPPRAAPSPSASGSGAVTPKSSRPPRRVKRALQVDTTPAPSAMSPPATRARRV